VATPDQLVQGTPWWWLARLEGKLNARLPALQLPADYFAGKHRLLFATEKFRKAFGEMFKGYKSNWCKIVVKASEERLNPLGFRLDADGDQETGSAEEKLGRGDKDAWLFWQANQLDAASKMLFTEAIKVSEASLLVWAGPRDGIPQITVESATQMITDVDPGTRQRRAALKVWQDDWGSVFATLYLPEGIFKFEAVDLGAQMLWTPSSQDVLSSLLGRNWRAREVPGETWPLNNPLGVVPVVPIYNDPQLLPLDGLGGISDLADVIPQQDAINKLLVDMLVASEFTAFRQRWATGLELPTDPESGQPLPQAYEMVFDRLLMSKNSESRFGTFEATDLNNYVVAVREHVAEMASQTRTPPHYFQQPSGQFPSGESIKSAETGLVAKSVEKQTYFGEGLEEAIRLAFAVIGSPKAEAISMETIWGDPESRSESQHIDALVKMKDLGLPEELLWEKAGLSPQEISRAKAMREEEAQLRRENPELFPEVPQPQQPGQEEEPAAAAQ